MFTSTPTSCKGSSLIKLESITSPPSASHTNDAKPVSDFYKNATILITGGTGFVGKVLIEKLLRSFQLGKVYMLIRRKDNMNAEQRLQQFFSEHIFDIVRRNNPKVFEKVYPITVNYDTDDLDIDTSERLMICNEVEIVFNVVASVKFNEKLSDAININVFGTKKILDLVMEMKNLKIFRIADQKTLEKLQHCLIGEMPNTYTMTKKCAENLVNHRAFYLPAGIFRPPIVMSTYKEPMPGWTDNLYGPSGLCTWSARGLVHCIYGQSRCKANLVPADYCVNAMIACAWDLARRYSQRESKSIPKSEIPVYNYIFDKNNLTWGKYMHLSRKGFHEPFDKALWCFSYIIIPSKQLHGVMSFFLHKIPGYILDFFALLTGQKRIYSKAYRKISDVIYMMSWFGLKEWNFAHRNIEELDALIAGEDRKLLPFNMANINWNEYFFSYLSGIRKYFFRDEASDSKLQRRKVLYNRIIMVHNVLKTTCGFTLIMFLLKMCFRILKVMPRINLSVVS